MSFEDINNEIRAKSGGFTNLKTKGSKVAGKIVAVESRAQSFKGTVLTVTSGARKGETRKEWLFTLEQANGEITKWAAKESAQWAITGALNGRKLAPGGHLQVEVMEPGVQGEKQAEFKVIYSDPTEDSPFEGTKVPDTDDPPF